MVVEILFVWGALIAVMLLYTGYRFTTDRRAQGNRHPLWPIASDPTDPMLPSAGRLPGWRSYMSLFVALSGFIGLTLMDVLGKSAADWSRALVAYSGILGVATLVAHKRKRS